MNWDSLVDIANGMVEKGKGIRRWKRKIMENTVILPSTAHSHDRRTLNAAVISEITGGVG